jgi:GTP-binding protein
MQIEASFVTSASGADDFPRERLPELAMVGRSNVGKSSLINALIRRPLARTRASPGKTRLANFFRVQRGTARAFHLVDLPGYGYARGGDASAREFQKLTEAYFARGADAVGLSRATLSTTSRSASASLTGAEGGGGTRSTPLDMKPGSRPPVAIGVLLLVDSRHPGLESDLEAWRWLANQPVARGIVGTKVDKLTRAERTRHAREFESLFQTPVLLVSAQTGEGLDELWKMIASLPRQTVA